MVLEYMLKINKYIGIIRDFISQVKNDWRKIVWPEKKSVLMLYALTLIACVIFAVLFLYIDMFMAKIMKVFLTFGNA